MSEWGRKEVRKGEQVVSYCMHERKNRRCKSFLEGTAGGDRRLGNAFSDVIKPSLAIPKILIGLVAGGLQWLMSCKPLIRMD